MAEPVPQSPYLKYVYSLQNQWPRLRLLADFANPNILISDYHEKGEINSRMNKVNVDVIDFEPSPTKPQPFSNKDKLTLHLDSKSPSLQLRVIMVENLSASVIELLGGKYSLDPRFFENHLRGIEVFIADRWTGDKTTRLESTSAEVLHREFFTVTYCRPYPFRGWPSTNISRLKQNVPRWANVARNLFLREKISLYGPIECDDGYFVAVILCDPLLNKDEPEDIYLRQNNQFPSYRQGVTEASHSPQRKQVSTRQMLEDTLCESKKQSKNEVRKILVKSMLNLALDFHAAALHELDSLLHRMDSMHSQRPAALYHSILDTINKSGGTIGLQEYVWMSLTDIKQIFINLLCPSTEYRQALEMELQSLDAVYSTVQRKTNRILEFLQQERQMREAKLGRIAFMCITISTIAAVLSIQDVARFVVFSLLILPIFIFAALLGIIGVSSEESLRFIDGIFSSSKALLAWVRKNKNTDTDTEGGIAVEVPKSIEEKRYETLPRIIARRKASFDEKIIRDFIDRSVQSISRAVGWERRN